MSTVHGSACVNVNLQFNLSTDTSFTRFCVCITHGLEGLPPWCMVAIRAAFRCTTKLPRASIGSAFDGQ